MKKLFLYDRKALRFFEKLVFKFNWLTGKDNFFLGRCFIFISIFSVGLLIAYFYPAAWLYDLLWCSCTLLMLFLFSVLIEKKARCFECGEYRSLSIYLDGLLLRLVAAFSPIGYIYSGLPIFWAILLLCSLLLVFFYILYTKRPPYKSAQWVWVGFNCRLPALAPASIHNLHSATFG